MSYLNVNEKKIVPVVTELNHLLSDYHIYYQKLRNFHWNIQGESFFDLHEKFEALYNDARVKIDEIAERILTLRYHPVSRLSEYLKISTLDEVGPVEDDQLMISHLLADHKELLKRMKAVLDSAGEAGDEGSIDLMGAYIRELEKESWMLESWSNQYQKRKVASMAEVTE